MSGLKDKVKDAVRELLAEDKEAEEKNGAVVTVHYDSEDETHNPTTKAPYMVVYIRKDEPPFRKKVVGYMSSSSMLMQGGEITCVEELGSGTREGFSNVEAMESDDRITILKSGLKKAPSREEMKKLKDAHEKPKPKKKESIIDKVKDKVNGKKSTNKSKTKGNKK